MSKWAGEGKDWIQLLAQEPPRKVSDNQVDQDDEAANGKETKERRRRSEEETKRCGPAEFKKLMLEIRSDSKKIVDWIDGRAKLNKCNCKSLAGMVGPWTCGKVWLIGRYTSFVGTTKKLMSGQGHESKVVKKNGAILRM